MVKNSFLSKINAHLALWQPKTNDLTVKSGIFGDNFVVKGLNSQIHVLKITILLKKALYKPLIFIQLLTLVKVISISYNLH